MIEDLYAEQREAILAAINRPGVSGDEPVPACPGWTSLDVVRHLVGLCDDWLTGNLEVYASADWTNQQVARFATHTAADLTTEWQARAADFDQLLGQIEAASHLPDEITTTVGSFPPRVLPGRHRLGRRAPRR